MNYDQFWTNTQGQNQRHKDGTIIVNQRVSMEQRHRHRTGTTGVTDGPIGSDISYY